MEEPQLQQMNGKETLPLFQLSPKDMELKELYNRLYQLPYNEREKMHNEIVKQVKYLRGEYPDANRRTVVSILAGSGISLAYSHDHDIVEDDFLGEDSVEKFLNDLVNKYKA